MKRTKSNGELENLFSFCLHKVRFFKSIILPFIILHKCTNYAKGIMHWENTLLKWTHFYIYHFQLPFSQAIDENKFPQVALARGHALRQMGSMPNPVSVRFFCVKYESCFRITVDSSLKGKILCVISTPLYI